jgi:hypothetical protein
MENERIAEADKNAELDEAVGICRDFEPTEKGITVLGECGTYAPYSYEQLCWWVSSSMNILKDLSNCCGLSKDTRRVLMKDLMERLGLVQHALADTKDSLADVEFRIYEH